MRSYVEKLKDFYKKGLYTIAQTQKLLTNGKITQEEYEYIIND